MSFSFEAALEVEVVDLLRDGDSGILEGLVDAEVNDEVFDTGLSSLVTG